MKNKTPLFSWMSPNLEIKKTSKYGKAILPSINNKKKLYTKKEGEGFAVYAKTPIKKGATLFVMGGYILDIEDENALRGIVADKPIEISHEFSISPRKASDIPKMPQHYVNHSCNPNAGFDGQIFLVAMRNIKAGEEITYDYAMIMQSNSKSDSFFTFDCLCDSKNCRKVISENDWKIESLQKRYDGYFQYFIQKKINKKKQAAILKKTK